MQKHCKGCGHELERKNPLKRWPLFCPDCRADRHRQKVRESYVPRQRKPYHLWNFARVQAA